MIIWCFASVNDTDEVCITDVNDTGQEFPAVLTTPVSDAFTVLERFTCDNDAGEASFTGLTDNGKAVNDTGKTLQKPL